MLTENQRQDLKELLFNLETEHRDLDDVIIKLQSSAFTEQLQLQRLKKRKLLLKDRIAQIKSELIPDLNA